MSILLTKILLLNRKQCAFIIASCFFYLASAFPFAANAQSISSWSKSKVCDHCPSPLNIYFSDALHGFLIAEAPFPPSKTQMYRTSDGGATWEHLSFDFDTVVFELGIRGPGMYYDTSGVIIVEVSNGTAISLDNGISWHLRFLKIVGREETAEVINAGNILVLGGDPFRGSNPQIIVSHDTGKSFQKIGNPAQSFGRTTHTSCIQDSNNVWFGSYSHSESKQHLQHTTDAGKTWNEVFPVADTSMLGKFTFRILKGASKNTVYLIGTIQILGQDFDFIVTTDNGANWSGSSGNNGNILGGYPTPVLQNPRGTEVWCVLYDHHTIGYSYNNGINWIYDSVTFKNDSLLDMIWQDSTKGYILGYRDSTITLYTHTESNSAPYNVNYIHAPFKIAPTITTDLIHLYPLQPLNGKIIIQDIFGRKVTEEKIHISESETAEYSLSHFSSGVYYVTYLSGNYMVFFKVIKL